MGYNSLRKQWKRNNNFLFIGLITQFLSELCNTLKRCADNSKKCVISTINHTILIIDIVPIYRNQHWADIYSRYQHDIGYPISIRYRPLIGRHRPYILIHIGPILGQLCKTEIRQILKSDIEMKLAR